MSRKKILVYISIIIVIKIIVFSLFFIYSSTEKTEQNEHETTFLGDLKR